MPSHEQGTEVIMCGRRWDATLTVCYLSVCLAGSFRARSLDFQTFESNLKLDERRTDILSVLSSVALSSGE